LICIVVLEGSTNDANAPYIYSTETTHDTSDQALPRSVLLCWKDPQMVPMHHTFIQLTNQIN
jgi:hypothetical protein